MAILTALDHNLFALLNGSLTSSFLDWFMPLITDAKTWMPLIAIIWLGLLFSGRPQMRVLALALLVSVGLTDLVCARVFKKAGARLRPCELSQKTDFKCRLLLQCSSCAVSKPAGRFLYWLFSSAIHEFTSACISLWMCWQAGFLAF